MMNRAQPDQAQPSVDELEREIEVTRVQLAETVDELAHRAARMAKPVSFVVAGVMTVAVVVLGVVVWKRRR